MHEFPLQSSVSTPALNAFLELSILASTIILALFFLIIVYSDVTPLLFPWAILFSIASFIFALSLRYLEKFYTRSGEHRYSTESGAAFVGAVSLLAFGILFLLHTIISNFLSGPLNLVTVDPFLAYLSGFVFAIFQIASLIYAYGFLKFGRKERNITILSGGILFLAGGVISGILIWETGIIFTPLLNLPLAVMTAHLSLIRDVFLGGMFMLVCGLFLMFVSLQRTSGTSL